MSLTRDDVRKIAYLARLSLTEAELSEYAESLSRILELVGQMNAVDTEGVEPLTHPLDMPLRLRKDRITESDARDAFQRVAPQTEAGLYLVPKVIE